MEFTVKERELLLDSLEDSKLMLTSLKGKCALDVTKQCYDKMLEEIENLRKKIASE